MKMEQFVDFLLSRMNNHHDDQYIFCSLISVIEKRGTTVMLFVASFAFLLLLGPFYVHWCITYLFHYHPQCHFTRNIYENVQVCMGVFHPYLTVIEKGMRECNHAVNFLLYMATSKRFREDFQRICRMIFYRIFGSTILFLYKHLCFCCTEPSCLVSLERHVSDTTELDSTIDNSRKNQNAYKTSHYYTNYERRRQQLLQQKTTNNTTTTASSLTPATSLNILTKAPRKTVRTLTWTNFDRSSRSSDSQRQAARLSEHYSNSKMI